MDTIIVKKKRPNINGVLLEYQWCLACILSSYHLHLCSWVLEIVHLYWYTIKVCTVHSFEPQAKRTFMCDWLLRSNMYNVYYIIVIRVCVLGYHEYHIHVAIIFITNIIKGILLLNQHFAKMPSFAHKWCDYTSLGKAQWHTFIKTYLAFCVCECECVCVS